MHTGYPSYALCQAFTVMLLGDKRKHNVTDSLLTGHFARLGKAFGLRAGDLAKEVAAFRPAAAAAYAVGMSTWEAWRVSITRKTRSPMPSDAVRALLVKYAGCSVSTHRIDSSFSTVQQRTLPQQSHRSDFAERYAVHTMLDRIADSDVPAIITRAQTLWRSWFGAARAQPTLPRIDTGRPRPRNQTPKTAWLAKRRRTVAAAAANYHCNNDHADDGDGLDPTWADTHDAELAFQHEQQTRHRLEAFHDGTLLLAEATPEIEAAATGEAPV